MSKLTDKVSYLKGLAAGMKLNMEKDSNKLLLEILGAMGDMAEEIQRMDEAHRELQDYVESIDDDLAETLANVFGSTPEFWQAREKQYRSAIIRLADLPL